MTKAILREDAIMSHQWPTLVAAEGMHAWILKGDLRGLPKDPWQPQKWEWPCLCERFVILAQGRRPTKLLWCLKCELQARGARLRSCNIQGRVFEVWDPESLVIKCSCTFFFCVRVFCAHTFLGKLTCGGSYFIAMGEDLGIWGLEFWSSFSVSFYVGHMTNISCMPTRHK